MKLRQQQQQMPLSWVKDERRMEFCFEAFRWFDLRRWDRPKIVPRFSSAENPSNYIEYVLQQDDPCLYFTDTTERTGDEFIDREYKPSTTGEVDELKNRRL